MFGTTPDSSWATDPLSAVLHPTNASVQWMMYVFLFVIGVAMFLFIIELVANTITGGPAGTGGGGGGGGNGLSYSAAGQARARLGRPNLRQRFANGRARVRERPRTAAGWSYMIRRQTSDAYARVQRRAQGVRNRLNPRHLERSAPRNLDDIARSSSASYPGGQKDRHSQRRSDSEKRSAAGNLPL